MSTRDDFDRTISELPPDLPEAIVGLIDALVDYLDAMHSSVPVLETPDDIDPALQEHWKLAEKLLADLREWEIDQTLGGLIGH